MTGRKLTPKELAAWRAVRQRVRPLGSRPTSNASSQPYDGNDLRKAMLEHAPSKTGQSLPQDRGNEKRIRRGQQTYSAALDLHGHSLDSAWAILPSFLSQQRRSGARCVLIITGKGKQGEGVLRRHFLQWLDTSQARDLISGYASAHNKHGGSGAWYVFLRART